MQRSLRHVSPPPAFCLCRAIASASRHFSVSPITRAEPAAPNAAQDAPEEDEDAPTPKRPEQQTERGINYKHWLTGEGAKYKNPLRGTPNWLGEKVPFPTNPTFRPPTPNSNALREIIYQAYQKSSNDRTVRALSSQYGISIDRINAIIRLKNLETEWAKGRPLEMALCQGMESYLGVKPPVKKSQGITSEQERQVWGETAEKVEATVVEKVDAPELPETAEIKLDEAAAALAAKPKSHRIIWEMVGEGIQPTIAVMLEEKEERRVARNARVPPALPEVRVPPSTPGRPEWVFMDVGHKYVDTQAKQLRNKTDLTVKPKPKEEEVVRGRRRRTARLKSR